jgi:hypothetical protein
LAELEERAQKTEVLTHWGDELFEFVKAIPQSECLFNAVGYVFQSLYRATS